MPILCSVASFPTRTFFPALYCVKRPVDILSFAGCFFPEVVSGLLEASEGDPGRKKIAPQ